MKDKNKTKHPQLVSDLRESEIRYRRLFEAAKDGILVLDADSGAITDANPFIEEILGYSPEDLIGKKLWEIGAFFDVVASKAAFEELRRKEYIRYANLPLQATNGQLREVEFISNVYLVDQKKVIQCNIREIDKHKRMEKILESQHTLLTAVINSSCDIIIFAIDKNYCYTVFNEKHREEMKRIWKVDIKIGMNLLDCMQLPDLRELAKQSIDRALRGEAFLEIQHQPQPDIYYEFNWSPIWQNNEVVGVTVFIKDITRRKRIEQDIETLAHFPAENPDPVLRVERYGKIKYANPASETLLHLWNCKVGECLPSDWQEIIVKAVDDNISTTVDVECEEEFYSIIVMPIPDAGYVNLYGRNITMLKRAEESLRENEERYRRLFETAQDGILILDAESGFITDANPFIVKMLGYSGGSLIGNRLWEVGAFIDRAASMSAFEELQKKGYIRYENLPLETKDGESRQVEFVSNVYTVNGKKVIQCNIRDITKRKWLEDDKQKLMNNLQWSLAHIKELKGMLPICSNCKKIRNDKGYWQAVEGYIIEHTDATFTHGLCSDCINLLYPNYVKK